jgi:reactive intermediate/imine deaminase
VRAIARDRRNTENRRMQTLVPVIPAQGPAARGHYSPGIRAGNLLFVSGQLAVTPQGESLAGADLETQTRQALANLRAVVEAAGGSLDRVARVTVYLADPQGWPVVNRVYAEVFGAHRPARAVVPVAPFAGGFIVEVEAIAVLGDDLG